MAQTSKHDASSSSSSESSEDEEEARKIREALCDESLFKALRTDDQNNQRASAEQLKNKELKSGPLQFQEKQKNVLKSNRLLDKNDREDDKLLQTTPEFRVHVAKQLSIMLDGVIGESLMDKVWQTTQAGNIMTTAGIRLFSDSKTRCRVGDPQYEVELQQLESKRLNEATPKHRKHKLSTSSESSEDEKISSCVFSVADIHKENESFAILEKQAVTRGSEKSASVLSTNIEPTASKVSNNSAVQNSSGVVKKKKKRRKEKSDTKINGIT